MMRPGHLESTAAAVEHARETLLAALGKTYSIVVLASLSLVVAAFSRNIPGDAVSYAVAASSSFYAAVVLTLIHEVRRSARPVFHIEVGLATIVAIVAGFVTLGMVVFVFPETDLLTGRVTVLLLGTITLVAFRKVVLGMHEATDRIRSIAPETWARQRPYLRAAPWIAAGGCVVLAATLILFVFGVAFPSGLTAAGLLAFLGPYVYLRAAGRSFSMRV